MNTLLTSRSRSAMKQTPRVLPILALLMLPACLRPAEERAARDESVGLAAHETIALSVHEGLAAVRALDADRATLWSSAPAYRFTLDNRASEALDFELRVENCLPDSVLEARTGPGTVVSGGEPAAKTLAFALRLPAESTTEFSLSPPDALLETPFRFGVLSDVQEAIDRVQDIFRRMNQDTELRFLLGAGDLTEGGSVSELSHFQRELEHLRVPYYTTLGNHELGAEPSGPTPYQDWFGRANFRFVFRGVQFSLLDSASATIDPQVHDWLDGWLAEGRNRVHIVAMHIPPVDPIGVRNGSFASRGEAAKLLTKLAGAGVDLTLYGHVHTYHAFENAGIEAHISGGGGAIPERFDGIDRHYLSILVDAENGVRSIDVVRVDP